MSGITRDEWLRALGEVTDAPVDSDPSAITIAEFAQMFALSRSTASKRLRLLEASGKAQRTMKQFRGSDGRMCRSLAFKLT